jgi:tyrosine-protein phosphatase YwqE
MWKKAEKSGRPKSSPVLPVTTDLHSHLIPSIDDGVESMETALELLRGLERLGYRRIVTTPHVMADSYRNDHRTILAGLEDLREAARQRGIALEIEAAAEYYLDEEFLRRLEAEDLLTIGRERWVLFETSYYNEPFGLRERIYEISSRGYRPMLAHPERYRYVRDPEAFYGELRSLGTAFQVNINSLGGCYGEEAKRKAAWLARRGWIDFLGSDLHGRRHLECLERTVASGVLESLWRDNRIRNDELY